jgi:tetratricopeptide (TPR) repeat protein
MTLNPNSDDARLELGEMYYRAGQWPFVVKWLQPYVQKHPENKELTRKYLKGLYMSRMYKEVIPVAESLLKDSTNSANLLRMLAYSNVLLKNYGRGLEYYSRLRKVEGLTTDDLRKMALAFTETKQDSSAASCIEQILKSDSTNTAMYAELGAIYMKMRQYDKAADNFEKRFKSDTSNYSAYYNYASCKMVLQEFEDASKGYIKVLELNPPGAFPQVASSQYFLGGCYLQLKMYPEARKAFEGYLKMTDSVETKFKKDRGASYKYVGLFLLLDKKYEEGVKYERKSIELDDNDSEAHTWLGQCYHNLQTNDNFPNARESAIKEYKRALQINKNNKEAKKLLDMLEPQ